MLFQSGPKCYFSLAPSVVSVSDVSVVPHVQKKQEMMRSLLAPIANKFEGLLASLCAETDEGRQVAYAKCISNAMGLARYAVQFIWFLVKGLSC